MRMRTLNRSDTPSESVYCADRVADVPLPLAGDREPTVGAEAASPVPLKPTGCVLPATPPELSVKTRFADRLPVPFGVKITDTVQLAPTTRLEPQVVVFEKSPGFVPLKLMLVISSVPVPLFVSVTFCA